MKPILPIAFLAFALSWVAAASVFADIASSAEEIRPILIGTTVPDVVVQDIDGNDVSLATVLSERPTVLIVYRGGWCPICTRQFAGLRDTIGPLTNLGIQVIGLSADSPAKLREGREDHDPLLRLYSDFNLQAAEALGLAFHVSDDYVGRLKEYKLDTAGNAVSTVQALPVPAVFVIDSGGVIRFSYVNPNYKVRCDPNVILAAARSVVQSP